MMIMGIDVGSSCCKCVAFKESGEVIAVNTKGYGQGGALTANSLMDAVYGAIQGCWLLVKEKGMAQEQLALTVSSFGESFIPIDRQGNSLGPVSMYTEGIGQKQADDLLEKWPDVPKICGAWPNPMYALPRMLRQFETDLGLKGKLWKFLQIADYVIYRLTGETVIDYSLACRALAFDVLNRRWSEDVLHAVGMDASMLSRPVETGTVAGELSISLAQSLGLPKETLVVVGAHDQVVSALGAGAIAPGQAAVGTGSVECVTPVFASPVLAADFLRDHYALIPYPCGGYATYAFTISGGALLQWYTQRFAPLTPQGRPDYDRLNIGVDKGCGDLLLIPHFIGSGTPELSPKDRGTISGMDVSMGVQEIYTGIMEGLCFEMMVNRQRLTSYGIHYHSLSATGGGARSAPWLQMKADALGLPVASLKNPDAGAAGGAMLAAVACGVYKDIQAVSKAFVRKDRLYEPNPGKKTYFAEKYQRYIALRSAIEGIV